MRAPRPVLARCSPTRSLSLVLAGVLLLVALALVAPAIAFAEAPWWRIESEVVPSYLPPEGNGEILVAASSLSDATINGAGESPIVITAKLPEGLIVTGFPPTDIRGIPVECTAATFVRCTYTGVLYPYERMEVPIELQVEEPKGTNVSLPEELSVEGGGAAKVSSTRPVHISGEAIPFGVQGYQLLPLNPEGTPATQAGSHPFQLTTTLILNQTRERYPIALPKDLRFNLPPGLIGNPTIAAQCSMAEFSAFVDETNACPPSSVVGVAAVTVHEPLARVITRTVPVFNLVPAEGEPARFGLAVIGKVPIIIDTSVRTGKDYGVVASVSNATQVAGLLSSQVTLWGVPGDPRHNASRGWECVANGEFSMQIKKTCPASSEVPQQPFLTLPTSCPANPASEPLTSSMEANSWATPGNFLSSEYAWLSATGQGLGMDGCNELPFTPSIGVTPEVHTASTPTGLSVNVEVPQKTTLEANGLAEADVRDTTVTLPEGVQLSPAAANGLEACSEAQVGYVGLNAATQTQEFTDAQASCPAASKVGLVHIKTPLLSHELEGAVYLASPAPNREAGKNPFNSLVALYLVAEDPVSGVLVKLAGGGELNESTLRVSTRFTNAPQVPFEDLKLDLFGGARASVSTPARCGAYGTEAAFTPWSGTGTVTVASPAQEFEILSGAHGEGCSGGTLGFSPGFDAQATNTTAGSFTDFQLELTRPDGDQALSSVSMHLPPGNAALLSSVTLCAEPEAARDECPTSSEVGHATAVAGLGPEPYVESGGRVFITGPYGGAPFGLEIVSPAVAGPFNLGTVTVRSKLFIDRDNASVTIVSDPLPTELRGIPLQLKRVLVTVNRPNFEFNPTNCSPMKIEGTVDGAEGASAGVSSPFQVADCQSLPFAPKLTAATNGHASKADGTNFLVSVGSGGIGLNGVAQAGIAKVDLQLPKALPARLSTLQKACTEAAFNANPASCPEGSDIGTATIHTPVLKNPLSGPAYLVSHGNAAFPDVEFVLQGEGITLVLDGKTQIKDGITYSKFESAPDAPFTRFETVLPAGPHSALTANVAERKHFDVCGESLAMPTTITGQNGAVIERSTRIAIDGCGAVRAAKTRKLTNAQKLAKALAACRKRYTHAKTKRLRCERLARKRYPHANKAKKGRRAHTERHRR